MTGDELKPQFQKIEDILNAAYEKNDIGEISELLSDDWTILEPSIGLSDKERFLAAIKDGNLIHSSMKKEVQLVRLYNDLAIVVTRGKNEGRYLDRPFDGVQWITNLYRKNNSKWICVMTLEAPVSC